MPPNPGFFVVIEGIDRAGKTTQTKLLVETLRERGLTVVHESLNRTTSVGKLLDEYLRGTVQLSDCAAHLLFSAVRWEAAPRLQAALAAGHVVVADRYSPSGAAYTYAKGVASLSWCTACDDGLPEPDIVIQLQLDPSEAATRGEYGGERYETGDFQRKVADAFAKLRRPTWRIIDVAAKAPAAVATFVLSAFDKAYQLHQDGLRRIIPMGTIQPSTDSDTVCIRIHAPYGALSALSLDWT